ncbi:Ni/Fe hydrogenase, partial [bacterium]|nr:Ni/Fe hydrogenase [bacterium]
RGLFAKTFDDEGARKGWCLYKLGCKGPVAYNACANVKWNQGVSFPIQSGHGCIGCCEPGFWDNGGIYESIARGQFGTGPTMGVAAMVGAGVGAGAALAARSKEEQAAAAHRAAE